MADGNYAFTTKKKKCSFIVEVTFIVSLKNEPDDVSFYIEEHTEYSLDNIDLIDAMYDDDDDDDDDDDPNSLDGMNTTRIVMPFGLIDANEDFYVYMVDENDEGIYECY